MQDKISSVGGMALYLFRALPLEIWEPTSEDITCLSHWLLFMPAASVENQLARIIFSKLNWGENETKMQLVLPQELHQKASNVLLLFFFSRLLTEGYRIFFPRNYVGEQMKCF